MFLVRLGFFLSTNRDSYSQKEKEDIVSYCVCNGPESGPADESDVGKQSGTSTVCSMLSGHQMLVDFIHLAAAVLMAGSPLNLLINLLLHIHPNWQTRSPH